MCKVLEPSNIVARVGRPTAQIAVVVLAVELFSLVTIGSSPAFMDAASISSSFPRDLGYLALVISLCGLPVMIVALPFFMLFNELAYRFWTWPLRRSRYLRLAMKFGRRKDYVDTELVRQFATNTHNKELLEEVRKFDGSKSAKFYHLPTLIFVLLLAIFFISDADQPNFMMKICSLNEPVLVCNRYWGVVILTLFQVSWLMALYGWILRQTMLFPRENLSVPVAELYKYRDKTAHSDFKSAKEKWLGRAK